MPYLSAVVAILLLPGLVAASETTLAEARRELLKGNYAEARSLYAELVKTGKDAKDRAAAAVGQSKALAAEGEYDQALTVLEPLLKEMPAQADLLARQGEILYLRGRWDEAEKSARKALEGNDAHFLARWVVGQVLRDRGQLEEADEQFRWFVRTYTQRSNNDMEITDPDELLLVGLAGSERARWHHLSEQFQFIVTEIHGASVKQDKLWWPGEYQAGALFLEKYNKAAAARAFDKALTINPRAAEVWAAKGVAAMQRFEVKDADHYAEQALQINPRLPAALRLRADVLLFAGDTAAAEKELAKAREVNPREETTLARLAAILFIQRKPGALQALVNEVAKRNPKAAVFHHELGECLGQRRHFAEAEKQFLRAIELQPKLPAGANSLGLLYMQMGREDEARKILEKAFEADDFNVRVANSLKVLDHLEKYATLKTAHFHIRYDPANDKVLANFLAHRLEEIYRELAERFDYRPEGPFLIEVFNKHEMFSGRVVALPDLHTIGACTGRVVAMVSPRDKSGVIGKPFNWVRVMRHELVHIFNLEQTKFQVPHWFTEGLAVTHEGFGPPPRWHYLLAEKLHAAELLNLDNILLGFIRPSSPEQWQQAYLQSQLYVEYLTDTHGPKAVGAMLAAFAEGLDTVSALHKACNVDKETFEKGYRGFLEQRVKKTPAPLARKTLSFTQLKDAHAKDPQDLDIAAQLADRYLLIANRQEARKLADQVLEANKKHALAAYVKARLLYDAGESDQALALLEGSIDAGTKEMKAVRLLGRLQVEAKKLAEAAGTFELGRMLEPFEPAWLQQLAVLYGKTSDQAKLMDVLEKLAGMDPDDLATRKKLAQMLWKEGKAAQAERFARQMLEIDVLDADGGRILLEALAAQNKNDEVETFKKLLTP